MRVTVLTGNPKPESRTLQVANALAEAIAMPFGSVSMRSIDLATVADRLFVWPDDRMTEMTEAVAESDLAVIASPTYKAAYTGMLKAFLDRYPNNGLDGVVAVPVMTGAGLLHALAVDMALRPVLVELGAMVPSRGLYFVISDMPVVAARIASWVESNAPAVRDLLAARPRLGSGRAASRLLGGGERP